MSEQAPERPAPGGGGFSLTKRYGPLPAWAWGLLGGAALYAGYRFWKNRQGAAAATTAPASTDQGTGIDYAPQIATIQSEVQQLQGTEAAEKTPADVDTDTDEANPGGGGGGGKPPTTSGGRVRVPEVTGQRASFAISTVEAQGLEAVTAPPRNPRREYSVTGQTPRAGALVPRRSVVVLRVRLLSAPAAPKPRRPAQTQGGGVRR